LSDLLARFWCEVLGYAELERDEASRPPGGFGGPQPTIVFSRADESKAGKLRLRINVNATDREQDDELERLLATGAHRVDIGQPAPSHGMCSLTLQVTNSAYRDDGYQRCSRSITRCPLTAELDVAGAGAECAYCG
jgi:hypothetical protein